MLPKALRDPILRNTLQRRTDIKAYLYNLFCVSGPRPSGTGAWQAAPPRPREEGDEGAPTSLKTLAEST